MKTITVKLPESLAAWLKHRAGNMRRTQSDIVRGALEREQAGTREAKSCGELLSELGPVFPGSKDLSTNPAHLRGFGA